MRGSAFEAELASAVKFLIDQPLPVRACQITAHLGVASTRTTMLMGLARQRKVPGFTSVCVGRVHYYTIGDKRLPGAPKPKVIVHPVKDIYRGWYNPATGLTGTRLGV